MLNRRMLKCRVLRRPDTGAGLSSEKTATFEAGIGFQIDSLKFLYLMEMPSALDPEWL